MKAISLIVAGTPFSGAALLGHALGAHSQAFFAGELWRHWDRAADPGTRECRTCAAGCAAWNDSVVTAAVANGPAAVSAALAATTGRPLVIEGPASASWLAARLADGEPSSEDARIVVCVCDPLLYVRKRAGVTEEYAKQRVAEWRDQQNALVSAALSSGRPLLVVRYEDLADRLEETLARVCGFAGLEYEPELAEWWEAPTHAIGAKSEAWGVAEPVHKNRPEAAPGDPRQRRVATMPTLDRDPGASLGADVARVVIAGLRPTGLYETFGYEPVLPPYLAPQDDAERQNTAAWVKEDLHRTREAVLDGRASVAIPTLKLLVDHFGPAFDDLGLEAKYENLALVLVDLLNHQQRGAEALPYARALAEHAPRNAEALRLLAVASASAGDVPATLEAYGRLVRMNCAAGTVPESLPRDLADLLSAVNPDEPTLPVLLDTLADHPQLAAAVTNQLALPHAMDEKLIPPRHLINLVGGASFEDVGGYAFTFFLRHHLISPRTRVLDVGCGCGRVAAQFVGFLDDDVDYHGFDVNDSLLQWCNHAYPANFKFFKADLYNSLYNPTGSHSATDFTFPYGDASFDLVYLGSVFTHMLPDEVEHYINEINRVLAPGGRAVSTFFLMRESARDLRLQHGNLTFANDIEGRYWLQDKENPSAAVGYTEAYVRSLCNPEAIEYGFQDYVIWRASQKTAGTASSDLQRTANLLSAIPGLIARAAPRDCRVPAALEEFERVSAA